jgi:hypothetical protein
MKTTIKHENTEFFVIILKHVSGFTGHTNPNLTPKLWAITHDISIKRENTEFSVITLKHVSGVMSHVNNRGTPKLWAIADENGHKTREW